MFRTVAQTGQSSVRDDLGLCQMHCPLWWVNTALKHFLHVANVQGKQNWACALLLPG